MAVLEGSSARGSPPAGVLRLVLWVSAEGDDAVVAHDPRLKVSTVEATLLLFGQEQVVVVGYLFTVGDFDHVPVSECPGFGLREARGDAEQVGVAVVDEPAEVRIVGVLVI